MPATTSKDNPPSESRSNAFGPASFDVYQPSVPGSPLKGPTILEVIQPP